MILRIAYWAVFTAALALYLAMVLWTLPAITSAAGGLVPFDLRLTGYSGDEARAFLDALGREDGWATYLGPQGLLDTFYPLMLAIVLGGAVWVLVQNRMLRNGLLVAIVIGALADYRENTLVVGLLLSDGPVSDAAVAAANLATLVKSAMTGLAMVVVCIALVLAGLKRIQAR